MTTDDTEFEAWSAELKQHGLWASRSLPEPWNTRRAASWERIFDVDMLARSGQFEDEVQATFERLDLADVIAVTEFTARGRPEPDQSAANLPNGCFECQGQARTRETIR
jgi:hypothetical protein